MSLPTETLTKITDVIKDVYITPLANELRGGVDVLNIVKSNSKGLKGRKAIITYRTGSNQGVGNALERGTLPTAGSRAFDTGTATLKYFYAPVELSGQEVHMIDSEFALLDVVTDALEDTKIAAQQDMNRQLMGDGSGRIGKVASVSSNTITLAAGYHAVWFPVGMEVVIYNGSGTQRTSPSTCKVVSINVDDMAAQTVTFDAMPTGVAANDYIYRSSNYSASYNLEFTGLAAHFSDDNPPIGTYQGKDRTASGNEFLQALVSDNSGTARVISTLVLTQAFQKSKIMLRRYPKDIIGGFGVANSYMMYLQSMNQPIERLVSETGFASKLKFVYGGTPVDFTIVDDAPYQTLYLFDRKALEWREGQPLKWEDTLGGQFIPDKNTDTLWGRLFTYADLICIDPKALHIVKDIKENSIT